MLQTTLHVVAGNAGIMATEIDKVDKAVQRMGITASSSRQSLVQMLQAKLDISWAPKLARAAQDLAVISGMNSSATFQRLLLNIQQMDALGLRWMGIMVSREQAEQRWADANNRTVKSMSRREQQEAFMIETHRKLLDLEGAYVASMDDVGKQLLSLERLTETLKQTLGDVLLPVYSALVRELGHFYEQLIVVARVTSANKDASIAAGEAVSEWAIATRQNLIEGAKWLQKNIEWIKELVIWAVELKLAIMGFRALAWIGAGAIAFVTFLTNTVRALAALRAGKIGVMAIMDIMTAKTVAAGTAQLALAVAHRGAATAAVQQTAVQGPLQLSLFATAAAADTAAVSLGALLTGWLALAAAWAVPIVIGGFVMVQRSREKARREKLSSMEQMEEAQEPEPILQTGENRPHQIAERFVGAVWNEIATLWNGKAGLQELAELRQQAFEKWQREKATLVSQIEADTKTSKPMFGYQLREEGPVQEQFLREFEAFQKSAEQTKVTDELYKKILDKRQEIATLQGQLETLPVDATAERRVAERSWMLHKPV